MSKKKKWLRGMLYIICFFLILILCLEYFLQVSPPIIKDKSAWDLKRTQVAENYFRIGRNWILKNDYGLWEAYVEGEAFERGAILGNLAKELIVKQEKHFVAQIQELVPSSAFLYVLRYLVGFFNRALDQHIPTEFLKEIYGETHFASDSYGAIGSPYKRLLNYHAAHDIGHALKDYAIVGCTSFSCWDSLAEEGEMIVGRNFDFYVGDKFAEDKIILFVNPDSGHAFASITWGGFIGVCSGMNEMGLTVTINAAKSGLPASAKTPISIVARSILQYAQNIKEAEQIAKNFETFVSESIMIGSAQDNRTVIIEKSIEKTASFSLDGSSIICSNHYQSEAFQSDSNNIQNILHSASAYRQSRTQQLLSANYPLTIQKTADILRDINGQNNQSIGLGNEKALNQLQGHHSVIFQPNKKLIWVSTAPYQLGSYLAYDLNVVFGSENNRSTGTMNIDSLNIGPDSLIYEDRFSDYMAYREVRKQLKKLIGQKQCSTRGDSLAQKIVELNPNLYLVHQLAGDYCSLCNQKQKALGHFEMALKKEIATTEEKNQILDALKALKTKK